MNREKQNGLIGTILFHSLLFLCVFLMSFAGGGNGDNGTGEAIGGLEVSLGEPDLGGPDAEAGYTPESTSVPETASSPDDATLTDDNSDGPILPTKDEKKDPKKTVETAPKITPPVYKKTTPNPNPVRRPDSKGLFTKKGGLSGDGTNSGNEGRDDGSIYGDKDGGNGNGDGTGDGDGDGKPGSGNGDGDGTGDGVNFNLSGFRKNNDFQIRTNRSGSGTVIIELCVYKDGRLKSARPLLGGTMTDKYFIDLALKAVKENTYSPIGNVSKDQCGKVKFTFRER
ncbi:MAG: hypothetical protein H6605_08505 [Flavobacteriales bacterium]|nr:hypothetical protein [Flavobacteriales bacterium]